MDAEEPNRRANQRPLPACSSPLSSPGSTQTWQPVDLWMTDCKTEQDLDSKDHHTGMQSSSHSCFYEELFCINRGLNTLVPLAGTMVTSSSTRPQSDVVKQGYLGKLERSQRRYFVLRGGSHTGPSRLEWYKSQEKFTAAEKSAGKSAVFSSNKQGVIYLRCCLGVSRVASSRKGRMVVLYAKDETLSLLVEEQSEQEEWYQAIKKLMEEERRDEEHEDGFGEEEDDGYCTLPPAAFFKEVWPVTVKPTGLGSSKSLAGESRLCLTASSLTLIRLGACSDLPSVTIPLLSVRRFGHLDGSFFVELGRSAPSGPGEIWMEASDQGNQAAAQHIHEVIREAVKALRVLPDFNRSPTSNHNQLLVSKRCRPKYRDKPLTVRPLGSRLNQPPRTSEIQTTPTRSIQQFSKLEKTDKTEPVSSNLLLSSHQSSVPETSCCVQMKKDNHPTMNTLSDPFKVRVGGIENWEPGEQDEGRGYMEMSPQPASSSSLLLQDDYMTMASPLKHNQLAANTSVQTSFNSSISDSPSPAQCPHQLNWQLSPVKIFETEANQSRTSTSSSAQTQDEARLKQRSAKRGKLSAQSRVSSSPVRSGEASVRINLFPQRGFTMGIQASPSQEKSQLKSASSQPSRRSWLSLCLPSCLQADSV